jgi:FAD synthetase
VGSGKSNIVLAEGTFDLLHYGHVYYLVNAKKAGGENAKLIVIVARDKTVEIMKGNKPVIPENQRRAIVESLKVVDEAILGYEDMNMLKVIKKIKPGMIALGYDKKELEQKLKRFCIDNCIETRVLRMDKFEEKEIDSSTKIRKKIIEKYSETISKKHGNKLRD